MKYINTKMRIIVVIPCYGESESIGDVVTCAKKYSDIVIVADDCSTDNTIEVAQKAGAIIIANHKRQGFGGNLIAGIKKALEYDGIIVTLDGDGQHNPDEIPQVVKPILNNEADIVIGSRFLMDYKVPKYRKFGIDVITKLYNMGFSTKLTDAQSCFRAYKREVLDTLELEDLGFGFSTEILIKARVKGYKMIEVPISCIYHDDFRKNSTMNPISHGVSVAFSTLLWRLKVRNGVRH